MGRLLMWVLLGILAWVWWKRGAHPPEDAASPPAAPPGPAPGPEAMLACAHCGLLLPQSETLAGPAGSGQVFCCDAHRRAAAEARP